MPKHRIRMQEDLLERDERLQAIFNVLHVLTDYPGPPDRTVWEFSCEWGSEFE